MKRTRLSCLMDLNDIGMREFCDNLRLPHEPSAERFRGNDLRPRNLDCHFPAKNRIFPKCTTPNPPRPNGCSIRNRSILSGCEDCQPSADNESGFLRDCCVRRSSSRSSRHPEKFRQDADLKRAQMQTVLNSISEQHCRDPQSTNEQSPHHRFRAALQVAGVMDISG